MADHQWSKLRAAVLASVRGGDVALLSRQSGLEPEELARLKAGFIDAGTAWLHQAAQRRTWIQINVTLNGKEKHPGASLVSGRLQDAVRELTAARKAEEFHFVFKPPGARIRFLGERSDLIPVLDHLFAALCEDEAISSWSRGLYDAETYQFGGEEGLGAAHSFFTVESLAVLSFWRLVMAGKATIGPSEFSLTLLDLFLRQVVGDEWELWDLWNKMELTGRDLRVDGTARERATDEAWKRGKPLLDLLRLNDPKLTWLPGPERDCLLQYGIKLPSLSARLRQLHSDGALLFPMREILPFWVIFHFNRMCFPADEQRFLSFLMSTVLSPKPSPMRVRSV